MKTISSIAKKYHDILEVIRTVQDGLDRRIVEVDREARDANRKVDTLLDHLGLRVEEIPSETVCASTKEEETR